MGGVPDRWRVLVALGSLSAAAQLMFTPAALGSRFVYSDGRLDGSNTQFLVLGETLAASAVAIALAVLLIGRSYRARAAQLTGVVTAAALLATGLNGGLVPQTLMWSVYGACLGAMAVTHVPLLIDAFPERDYSRVIAIYLMTGVLGALLALGFFSVGVAWLHLQPALLLTLAGLVALAAVAPAQALQDMGAPPGSRHLGEMTRRLAGMGTARHGTVLFGALAAFLVVLPNFGARLLQREFHAGAVDASLLTALPLALTVLAVGALALRPVRAEPGDYASVFAPAVFAGLLGSAALTAMWFAPDAFIAALLLSIATASLWIVATITLSGLMRVLPGDLRPYMMAIVVIALVSAGGLSGLLVFNWVFDTYGKVGTAVTAGAIALAGVAAAAEVGKVAARDVERRDAAARSASEARAIVARGKGGALLQCHGIEFSYDGVQVLFGVDLQVREGEMVGLLGTNGSGKSTLLRAISGILTPQFGTVLYDGEDITYVGAEARVRRGIVQVPGGRSVFGSLTVTENLRMLGYLRRMDKRGLDRSVDDCYQSFPRLAERRNVRASLLSGGEQQMLGLCKALILKPRVLCIDELSLGLSAKVVGELLETVRAINATGTAIVVVEQSVNIALALVERAYFLERGSVRFEGPARELEGRTDLLRSIFLGGVTKAMRNGVPGKSPVSAN